MDYTSLFLFVSFLSTFGYVVLISGHRNSRLPPGPYPLPIIGNLLKLSDKPHHSLATLSKRYGPLMSLKLGSITTIVVSSPEIAKEFFHTHDASCCDRSVPDAVRVMDDHDKYSIVWMPAGDQWRKLKRITKECLFSGQCVDASKLLREKKVQELLEHVNHCCKNEKAVNIGEVAFTTILNMLSNIMFSMDLAQYDSVSSQEFKDAVWTALEIGGKPNLTDFFPILKPFDPQGLLHQGNVNAKKLLTIFDKIIDERLQTRSNSSQNNGVFSTKDDVLDSLLNLYLKNESDFSRNDLRHLPLAIFIAGTDTITSTLEWAMSELIRNPKKMEKARSEVIKLMQNNQTNILESDISQLPYLQAVIKETFRLHPPAPFLVPRQAMHELKFKGYVVPKNAQILCNIWAMGRDPNVWSDQEMFMPERFLETGIDYKGQDFELIPFGAGRRICPGISISHRMLHTMLGSLIHKFHWKLEGNTRAQDMNMDETFGIALQKSEPLIAIPTRDGF